MVICRQCGNEVKEWNTYRDPDGRLLLICLECDKRFWDKTKEEKKIINKMVEDAKKEIEKKKTKNEESTQSIKEKEEEDGSTRNTGTSEETSESEV